MGIRLVKAMQAKFVFMFSFFVVVNMFTILACFLKTSIV